MNETSKNISENITVTDEKKLQMEISGVNVSIGKLLGENSR